MLLLVRGVVIYNSIILSVCVLCCHGARHLLPPGATATAQLDSKYLIQTAPDIKPITY